MHRPGHGRGVPCKECPGSVSDPKEIAAPWDASAPGVDDSHQCKEIGIGGRGVHLHGTPLVDSVVQVLDSVVHDDDAIELHLLRSASQFILRLYCIVVNEFIN